MKNNIRENMIWNSVGSIIYLAGQWLLTVLVVRMLGYAEAGILSLSMSLTNTFYSLANYGIRNFQVSDLKNEFTDKEYIYNRWVTSAISFLFCFIYCIFQGYDKYTCAAILWFMCFRVCESLQDVYYGIEQKNEDMKSIGISNIIKGIVSTVLFCIIVLLFENLLYALFAMVGVMLGVLVFYDKRIAEKFIDNNRKENYMSIIRLLWVCAPIAVNNFMTNYLLTYPKLSIEQRMGEDALGIYSSISTPVLIVQMAASYIFAPLIVVFAKHYQEKNMKAFFKMLLKVIYMIGVLGLAAMIFAKLFGAFFLKILFGKGIAGYVHILYPLVLCTVLTALIWFFNAILTVCREYMGLGLSSITSMVLIFSIIPFMVDRWQFNGASFALCISLGLKLIIMLVYLMKRAKER